MKGSLRVLKNILTGDVGDLEAGQGRADKRQIH